MSVPREVETERLLLRQWRPADRVPFAAANADARVMQYLPKVLQSDESDALAERIERHFDLAGRTADGAPLDTWRAAAEAWPLAPRSREGD